MPTTSPNQAVVRPRVDCSALGGARLLVDAIDEIVDESPHGVVWIAGGPGSGKTTAIEQLSADFEGDSRVVFLDEPLRSRARLDGESRLIIATTATPAACIGRVLQLLPWETDDLIEYLLAVHPAQCKHVMERFGPLTSLGWPPQLARIVLDRFAADASLTDPSTALFQEVRQRLMERTVLDAACHYCFALLARGDNVQQSPAIPLLPPECPAHVRALLRHDPVRVPLAAEWLMLALAKGDACGELSQTLPIDLVDLVGRYCRENRRALRSVHRLLSLTHTERAAAMSASIMVRARSTWRPKRQRFRTWKLMGAYFQDVNWPRVNLRRAMLARSDFSRAVLRAAQLQGAYAAEACFDRADLIDARLSRLQGASTSFHGAIMQRADLSGADLRGAMFAAADLAGADFNNANLTGAQLNSARLCGADLTAASLLGAVFGDVDLSHATLYRANMPRADLRDAKLDGARLDHARLRRAQLEDTCLADISMRGARLEHAYFTGSRLSNASLRESKLNNAHLAEIDWQAVDLRDADLRGASFHMGSSRSGLVGSPIACEGSKTGFYTDEREEVYFKRPEEIRKANLSQADLRGANIDGVDFYLVDLRGARLDFQQRELVRRCGAILDETCS